MRSQGWVWWERNYGYRFKGRKSAKEETLINGWATHLATLTNLKHKCTFCKNRKINPSAVLCLCNFFFDEQKIVLWKIYIRIRFVYCFGLSVKYRYILLGGLFNTISTSCFSIDQDIYWFSPPARGVNIEKIFIHTNILFLETYLQFD